MTDLPNNVGPSPSLIKRMRDELKAAIDIALPQTPEQFAERLIKAKWGRDIDPQTASLVTLDYDYKGHPAHDGIHQGQVAGSQSLLHALLTNEQTVGDGRFAENAFGLYTPPDIGPLIRIVANVDELADHGSGNHQTYEGIYRLTNPQIYGPLTQIELRPADFKRWVWELDVPGLYKAYLDQAWPSDAVLATAKPYALRTSTKAAFVMTAWLQRHEQRLTQDGLKLAMQAAGLPPDQAWETLAIEQLQAPTHIAPTIHASRLKLYRYTAADIWCFSDRSSSRVLLYIPGNSSPLHNFTNMGQLRQWIVAQGKVSETKHALAARFAADDREDGTFHAGVLTALDGMAVYPKQHWLTKDAGFFNNDGYWNPDEYISFDDQTSPPDPFAQLVLTMKQAAKASVKNIRSDAQVNRDNLSAVVEPVVKWINQFGPLALFVPGGDGLLALAGLIDAGYGLEQAVNGETSSLRSEGVTRTVFGLLNALALAGAEAGSEFVVERAEGEALTESEHLTIVSPEEGGAGATGQSRLELIRGIGPSVAPFSDEVLVQIGKVVAVDDDMLRLMQTGRPPTPLLADTISRFKIDQELRQTTLSPAQRTELFHSRYKALQHSAHEWVKLFQHEYPDLPKSAIEQILDRYGVDIQIAPDADETRHVFERLDSKARQYQQHVRLNRAYEGLYLRSASNAATDTLALHSLKNMPGWPTDLRLDILDGSAAGRILDRCGPLDAVNSRRLIKVQNGYQNHDLHTDFFDAVIEVLSDEQRSALQLTSLDPASALRRQISEHALSRDETELGLQRMDSGLAFEPQGLRGGGYPTTPQGEAMSHEMIKLQIKDLYPEFTNAQTEEFLQKSGNKVQMHIDGLHNQLHQLHAALDSWIEEVEDDIADMGVHFIVAGDVEAVGMNEAQIAAYNASSCKAWRNTSKRPEPNSRRNWWQFGKSAARKQAESIQEGNCEESG